MWQEPGEVGSNILNNNYKKTCNDTKIYLSHLETGVLHLEHPTCLHYGLQLLLYQLPTVLTATSRN